ncbi:MAG: hypothetical protein GX596_00855 [Propionibacterium sp.]|nr:hypothetical protein [Propionibacterium sp.]
MRKVLIVAVLLLTACVSRPDPDPAVMRDSAPPWDAPRDAISYIDAAGLEQRPLGEDTDMWVVALTVEVGGQDVLVPAKIGIDGPRAIQAVVHTHDEQGDVWLEGPDNDVATLGHFFSLWGVEFDGDCLASHCEELTVLADGEPVDDPVNLQLRGHQTVEVSVR